MKKQKEVKKESAVTETAANPEKYIYIAPGEKFDNKCPQCENATLTVLKAWNLGPKTQVTRYKDGNDHVFKVYVSLAKPKVEKPKKKQQRVKQEKMTTPDEYFGSSEDALKRRCEK